MTTNRDETREALVKAHGVARADGMKRDEAIVKAHEIAVTTKQTAVVYRRRLRTRYSDSEPPIPEYDYVAGSAYAEKPTKPAGLRLWLWVSVTGLERLVGRDECL
jgi:hypothetical protein